MHYLLLLKLFQFIATSLVILSKFVQLIKETVSGFCRQMVVDTTHVSGSLQKGLRGEGMNDEEELFQFILSEAYAKYNYIFQNH